MISGSPLETATCSTAGAEAHPTGLMALTIYAPEFCGCILGRSKVAPPVTGSAAWGPDHEKVLPGAAVAEKVTVLPVQTGELLVAVGAIGVCRMVTNAVSEAGLQPLDGNKVLIIWYEPG